MKREFLINLLFLLAINLLIKPIFIFGIDRNVQNLVGETNYGLYYSLLNITYLVQIIGDFGLQNYNNRYISQHRQLLSKYFPVLLSLKVILVLLYLLITMATGLLLGYSAAFWMLFALTINQLMVSMILFLRSNISGMGKYRIDSVLSVSDKLIVIIILSCIFWQPALNANFRIEWFIYAQLFSTVSIATISFFIVWKLCDYNIRISFEKEKLLFFFKKSLPYATIILLMTLYTRVDVLMLSKLLKDGNTQVGIYAAAYRLLDASNMVGYLFASLLLPMFARLLKTKEPISSLVDYSFRILFFGSLLLAANIFVFRQPISRLFYTGATDYWGDVLGWLMWSFVPVAMNYIFGALLVANDTIHKLNRIFILGIIVNIVINIVLIGLFQAVGTAISTLITQTLVTSLMIILAFKEIEIKIFLPNFWLILFTILAVAIPFLAKEINVEWKIQLLASVCITFLVGIICKMLPLLNFYEVMTKKNED